MSIHAPVKGATLNWSRRKAGWTISIHAPVKGATFIQRKVYYIYKDFNPRSREGSDSKNHQDYSQ